MMTNYTPVEQLAKELRTRLLPAHYGRSKAKTAYGLLSEVRREILAEPALYDQGSMVEAIPNRGASCETAFCRAGWVVALKGKLAAWQSPFGGTVVSCRTTSPRVGVYRGVENAWQYAQRVLGLSYDQADELFGGSVVDGTAGSKQHARLGAAGITKFQRKYAKQLRATKV